jgi:hypothetical protein
VWEAVVEFESILVVIIHFVLSTMGWIANPGCRH